MMVNISDVKVKIWEGLKLRPEGNLWGKTNVPHWKASDYLREERENLIYSKLQFQFEFQVQFIAKEDFVTAGGRHIMQLSKAAKAISRPLLSVMSLLSENPMWGQHEKK